MYYYIKNDNDNYDLVDDETDDVLVGDLNEIAVGFSYHPEDKPITTTLHKHGSEEMVSAWLESTRKSYLDNGFTDMANALFLVSGRFDISEINKIINNTGYLGQFLEKTGLEQGITIMEKHQIDDDCNIAPS